MKVELKILDPRLPGWGFPCWGSSQAAGLDLHACIDHPLVLKPQMTAVLISAGIALRIGAPDWCALVLPRSGLGHKEGLVLGNTIGVIDADYEGPCLISAWNRNPSGDGIRVQPGDRVAQLVFTHIVRPEFAVVPAFATREGRQEDGFGSTGVEAACRDPRPARNSRQSNLTFGDGDLDDMIRLTKKLLFAIEAVLDIAYNGGQVPVRSSEITEREGIPRRYLEPVLQELVRHKILLGIRGPSGGYRLARERRRISLGDIVRTVRGLETAEDPISDPAGSALGHQVVRPVWLELQEEMMRRLDALTLEELCGRAHRSGIAGRAAECGDFEI